MGSNFVSLGKDCEVLNFAVTGSATEVKFEKPIKSFIMQTSDNVSIQYGRSPTGPKWTIKAGGFLAGDILFTYETDEVSIGFVSAPGGAANVEVIGIF